MPAQVYIQDQELYKARSLREGRGRKIEGEREQRETGEERVESDSPRVNRLLMNYAIIELEIKISTTAPKFQKIIEFS